MKTLKKIGIAAAISIPMAASAENGQKFNLVFVFADQLRADVLGYSGDEKAITPNLDKFSKTSMNFNCAFSVSPVSAPYRSSLFTGKYISSTGMVINEINMNPNHRTIAGILNENGYNCGYIGKMHLNDAHNRPIAKGPERMGFNHYWAGYSFNHLSYNAYYYTDTEDKENVKISLKGKYGPQEFTTLACNYLEKASKEDKPFAMFLSWNPPHDPWVAKNTLPECYEKFKDTEFSLPVNFKEEPDQYMDRYPQAFFKGKTKWREDFIYGGGFQETMRCYYAMTNSIDEQFGRIINKLEELGLDKNTIVIFTSDHGEMFTSQGRMYKLTFYDEAARVPMLIHLPGGMTGESDVLLNTPDLMPTILGMLGLEKQIPDETEGNNLSFIMNGKSGKEPEFVFLQGMGHTFQWLDGFEWRAVRDHDYLYAKYLRDGKELLFNLKDDPYQMHDLAGNPEYKKILANYRNIMKRKMKELNDEFKPCTWYRDNWMYKGYSIKAAAQGEFKPLPPIEPIRGQK